MTALVIPVALGLAAATIEPASANRDRRELVVQVMARGDWSMTRARVLAELTAAGVPSTIEMVEACSVREQAVALCLDLRQQGRPWLSSYTNAEMNAPIEYAVTGADAEHVGRAVVEAYWAATTLPPADTSQAGNAAATEVPPKPLTAAASSSEPAPQQPTHPDNSASGVARTPSVPAPGYVPPELGVALRVAGVLGSYTGAGGTLGLELFFDRVTFGLDLPSFPPGFRSKYNPGGAPWSSLLQYTTLPFSLHALWTGRQRWRVHPRLGGVLGVVATWYRADIDLNTEDVMYMTDEGWLIGALAAAWVGVDVRVARRWRLFADGMVGAVLPAPRFDISNGGLVRRSALLGTFFIGVSIDLKTFGPS